MYNRALELTHFVTNKPLPKKSYSSLSIIIMDGNNFHVGTKPIIFSFSMKYN